MRIKNVLLDLDNTILDFDTAERAAITKTLRTLGIEPTDAIAKRYSEINLMFWEKLERGEINRRQTLVGRFAALFEELGVSVKAELAEDTYEISSASAITSCRVRNSCLRRCTENTTCTYAPTAARRCRTAASQAPASQSVLTGYSYPRSWG